MKYKGFEHPDTKFTEEDQARQKYEYGHGPRVRVGNFYIDEFWDQYNGPCVWIGDGSGEGGTFDLKHFEKFLKKYYEENF